MRLRYCVVVPSGREGEGGGQRKKKCESHPQLSPSSWELRSSKMSTGQTSCQHDQAHEFDCKMMLSWLNWKCHFLRTTYSVTGGMSDIYYIIFIVGLIGINIQRINSRGTDTHSNLKDVNTVYLMRNDEEYQVKIESVSFPEHNWALCNWSKTANIQNTYNVSTSPGGNWLHFPEERKRESKATSE